MPELQSAVGVSVALLLHSLGFPQHRIASLFDVNQGRISEIVKPVRDLNG